MLSTPNQGKAIEIFYSYAHEDEKLRNRLERQLILMKRQGQIIEWHDRKIISGREWATEINTYLNRADIILLLVSPDFLASDYCYSVEMKRAMERHEAGEARVIPIILRPVDLKETPFRKLQALPTNVKPVTRWLDRDEAFLDIANGVQKAIRDLLVSLPPRTEKITEQRSEEDITFHKLKQYEEAIQLNPNDINAYNNKGDVLRKLKRYEEALATYKQVIRLAPGSDELVYGHYNIGLMLFSLGREKEALITFENAIRVDPNFYLAHICKGIILRKFNHEVEALAVFEKVINLDSSPYTLSLAYYHKGITLRHLKRYIEALVAFEEAIQLNAEDVRIYREKGKVLDFLGRAKEAQQAYEKARRLS